MAMDWGLEHTWILIELALHFITRYEANNTLLHNYARTASTVTFGPREGALIRVRSRQSRKNLHDHFNSFSYLATW